MAWRLAGELRECLDSLAGLVEPPTFEVTVVLNGVADNVAEVAGAHPVVTDVIVRRENIGFGAAANLAVASARGDYVVFLNDDATVDPAWLSALVAAADADNSVGAVASLLLNYDGTVQEAGCRVLSFGATMQFGHGASLHEAATTGLLEVRDIDYGSAAALLVRRELFVRVGGFDHLFSPAYFEDVDLQFRLREQGWRIHFEPQARVYHHSGRSTAQDHWFKVFAASHARLRFVQRWAPILAYAPAEDDPVTELCQVPMKDIPPRELTVVGDGLEMALEIAKRYQEWLVAQLEHNSKQSFDIAPNQPALSRRELIENVNSLRARLDEIEARSLAGLVRMRAGVLARRRGSSRGRIAGEA